ncbi:DHHC domain-containing protein [Phytophthora infestans]|uniref:Palmitoyltransferase n=1 Tax=Phytophthora infestans TaxID=4787 RepID=A0A833S8U5_PHYIN|nr:DHHC domain-containing protein [Phytophthora infestans]KAF4042957.1 DHHC domain-containing protein [Phytophthora infestans]
MSIDSKQLGDSDASTASTAECAAKRAEVQRLREHLDKIQAGEDDEDALLLLALAQPVGTTDPLSCFCCCKFQRVGHSYILHERRVVSADGIVKTKLVIVGPHWIGVLVTLVIIVVSTGLFLSQHVKAMAWYNTLITLGLCSVTLYYLFQTTCTDPGIIRPSRQNDVLQTEDESEAIGLEAGQAPAAEGAMLPAEAFGPRRPSRRRYCDICGIEQDRSTDHCEDCGVCIAGYDHHCPWMGKCIGRDNMYAFKMFNVAWVVYVCFVLFISILSVDWGHAAVQAFKRTASGAWVPTQTQSP